MNPFNQKRFRGEHELGDAYMAIRAVYENIDAVVTAANNIQALRSGNIELKSDGLKLLWKYASEVEWKPLGDLSPFINQYIQNVVDVNSRMDALTITVNNTVTKTQGLVDEVTIVKSNINTVTNNLANTNSTVGSLSTQLSTLNQDLNTLIDTVTSLTQGVNTITQNLSDLTTRVEALESPVGP